MGCAASTPRVKPKPAATIAMATDAARRAAHVRGARPSDAFRTALPSRDVRALKAEPDELAARQRLAVVKSLPIPDAGTSRLSAARLDDWHATDHRAVVATVP